MFGYSAIPWPRISIKIRLRSSVAVCFVRLYKRRLSREASGVIKVRGSNGATRSHRPENAVALASFGRTVRHRVMASDGDCAPRSATRIASFHRFGLVTQVGLTGQSPLPTNEALS